MAHECTARREGPQTLPPDNRRCKSNMHNYDPKEIRALTIKDGEIRLLSAFDIQALANEEYPAFPVQGKASLRTVGKWIKELGLVSIYKLEQATKCLSRNQRLSMLASWFNGGAGLPVPPGRVQEAKLYLGHPALLEAFLQWVIRYLAAHDTVDGRISAHSAQLINTARGIEGKTPVRRY